MRYSNCPGAQDESHSPGAEHTNPGVGCGSYGAPPGCIGRLSVSAHHHGPERLRGSPRLQRSSSAPLGPQRQLRCTGEGKGSSLAVPAARCPLPALLRRPAEDQAQPSVCPEAAGGRSPHPRPQETLPQRLFPPASSRVRGQEPPACALKAGERQAEPSEGLKGWGRR